MAHLRKIVDGATSGDNEIIAAVANRRIVVTSLFIVSESTSTVRFESGAGGTALTGQMKGAAGAAVVLPYNAKGWFQTAAGANLNMELSGATSVDGGLTYRLA